jgi:hypothetical protein
MPFKKLQEQNTRVQYEAIIVKLLAMLLRPKTHYQLCLPEKVQTAINKLHAELKAGPGNEHLIVYAANNVLFRIWARVWTKNDINTIGDPTICFLALLMLKGDNSFQSPKNTTSHIAKLKYGLRIIMLSAIKHEAFMKKVDDITACTVYENWFTEKVDSTFNALCTLQHFASSLAYNEPGMPHIIWMDRTHYRTMRYKGDTIEFDKLPTLFGLLETDAIRIWKEDILMGLPLRIHYNEITDDPAITDVGYSFIFDKRNPFFKDRDILAKAILTSPMLSKQFLTGLYDSQGHPIWNIVELQKWLFNYSRFHEVQITSADMKGGSPSRGTEISCIEYINTNTRPRGLYMIGNHLAIMCQYHKSAAITGKDKVIPHSLDAVTSGSTGY